MRAADVLFVGVGACGFPGTGGQADRVDADPRRPDALVVALDAPAPDAPRQPSPDAPPPGPCDDPDLRVCLRFDAGSGADESGHGNNASIAGATTIVRTHPTAGDEDALAIDGTADVTLTVSDTIPTSGAFTVEAWVLLDEEPGAGERVVVIDHNGWWTLSIYKTADGMSPPRLRCLAGTIVQSPTAGVLDVPAGAWHHVACVFQTAVALGSQAFVDGVGVMGTASGGNGNGADAIALGQDAPITLDDLHVAGAIDNVRIWARALSSEAIEKRFVDGSSTTSSRVGSTTSPSGTGPSRPSSCRRSSSTASSHRRASVPRRLDSRSWRD